MIKRVNFDLVGCLKKLIPFQKITVVTTADAMILGGAVNANFQSTGNANALLLYITSQFQHKGRVDIVWVECVKDI